MNTWIESKSVDETQYSGDFAARLELAPHRQAIIVGDIAGHHAGAGDAAALRIYVSRLVLQGVPVNTILRAASNVFSRTLMTEATPFASLFLAVADLRKGSLEYASAGHEPALLFSADPAISHHHQHLPPTGPLLGIETRPVFGRRTIPLLHDSLLVVVTDGITEARRDVGDAFSFFGSAGISRAVHGAIRNQRDPAQEIFDAAVRHGGGELTDDASVVVAALSADNVPAWAQLTPA
jgi:serine phosphatase RsbU (regulator of sigma subunit)